MKKRLLLLPLLAGLVMGGCDFLSFFNKKDDPGTQDTPIDENTPAVKSVAISGNQAKLSVGLTMQLSASVEVVNGASNSVTWSTSAESVATVSTSGLVTGIAEGEVTITATSSFDATKSASVTIRVVEEGFDPSWIEEGFTYSKEFPVEKIKEFLGEGEYEILGLDNLVGGCYYLHSQEEDSEEALVVVVDGVHDEDYAYALLEEGFDRVYYSDKYSCYEAVDPTGKYTVDVYSGFDEETYEYVAPTFFEFYKSEDVWSDNTLTEDTEWSAKHYSEDSEGLESVIESYLVHIPFIKMGAEYEINYVDNSLMRALAEAFGLDPNDYPDQFYICDYTLAYDRFEGYGETLVKAGFKEESDKFGTYYVLNAGLDEIIVYTGFGEGGNTIYAEKAPAILEAWPTEYVNTFIAETIGSKYELPAYDKTEGASYSMSLVEEELEDGSSFKYAEIAVSEATKTEAEAYFQALEEAGFKVTYTEGDEESYPCYEATKGKIYLLTYFVENYDEDSKEFDPENGSLAMYLYADESQHEDPGVYLPESLFAVLSSGEIVLEPEIIDLESPVFNVVSSNTEVATVEGFTVTLVAVGQTDITVSVAGTEYTATVTLTVNDKSLFQEEVAKANELFALAGAEEPLVLPDIECELTESDFDEKDLCYEICFVSEMSVDEYADLLEEAGFEITTDQYGYPVASKGDYVVEPWDYYGEFVLDLYYKPAGIGGDGITFDFAELNTTSGSVGGVSFTTAKASGQSAPAYNANNLELRLYANNTITFTSEEPMTLIFFDANTCGESKATGSFVSASTGTVSAVDGGFLWEGSATEVTLTVSSSGQIHINTIEINGGGEGGGGTVVAESEEEFIQELICLIFDQDTAEFGVDYWDEDGLFTAFQGESLTGTIDQLYALLSQVYECEQYNEDGYYGFYVDSLDGTCYADVYSYEHSTYGVMIEIDIYSYDF